jgi:hypothetical protein
MLNRSGTDSVLFNHIRPINISDLISHQNVFVQLQVFTSYHSGNYIYHYFNIRRLNFPYGVYSDMTDESRNSLTKGGCHC